MRKPHNEPTSRIPGYKGIYAVGDCASIPNPYTGKDYPPTAQNAIEEGRLSAKNNVYAIQGKKNKKKHSITKIKEYWLKSVRELACPIIRS